ncbi:MULTISPECIES: GYF domain-containing protein [unclassified Bradyrhizobium]|uniref:GYF domain-containing protein n=1 Tax=unclassified Bradyrhizobium TaxID=2631580 RepID=UPI000412D28F|nr:DUF4339 domain-containing protein [Bradyrhizobium sp. 6(2017)]
MSNRSWFYASEGQQKGPCSDAELRNLFARRKVSADTLVWSEGMSSWTKAGDVPGLLNNAPQPTKAFGQGAARLDPSFGNGDAPLGQTLGTGKIQELDITLGRLLKFYWLFLWRSFLGSVVIGFVLGFFIGFGLRLFGAPPSLTKTMSSLAGAVVGVVWSIVCLRMAFEKKYSDFRIAFVPRDTGHD